MTAVAMGFTVTVDGKVYGPFPKKDEPKFAHLKHKKGVVFQPVRLQDGSLSLSLSLAREESGRSIPHF